MGRRYPARVLWEWNLVSWCRPFHFAVLGCATLLLAVAARAHAEPPVSAAVPPVSFSLDIPALPLGDALERFSRVTGIAVLVDSEYAARRVPGVRGDYRAGDALREILRHERLAARWYSGAGAFLVRPIHPVPDVRSQVGPSPPINALEYRSYAGKVQSGLWRALCRDERTRPGDYRVAMQLWVGDEGAVKKVGLLSSTGDHRRDVAIIGAARSLSLGWVPARMPQPVTLLLTPGPAPDCSA